MLFLRYDADVRMLAFQAVFAAVTYHRWTNTEHSSWPVAMALFLFSCHMCFVLAVATHNHVHMGSFKYHILNKLWNVVLSVSIGHPVSTFIPGHNYSHHAYVQSRKDIMRTYQMKYSWNLLNLLLFAPTISKRTMHNDLMYLKAQGSKGRPVYKQAWLEFSVTYAFLAYCLYTHPYRFVTTIWLPQVWAKYAIITLNMLQHDGCDMHSKYNFARNFTSPVLNWWCMNNGYHTIHHMYAGLHWSLLVQRHAEKLHGNIDPNLEQPSILWYIFTAYVYPGKRLMYTGKEFEWAADAHLPNIDWAYDSEKTEGNIGGVGEEEEKANALTGNGHSGQVERSSGKEKKVYLSVDARRVS